MDSAVPHPDVQYIKYDKIRRVPDKTIVANLIANYEY